MLTRSEASLPLPSHRSSSTSSVGLGWPRSEEQWPDQFEYFRQQKARIGMVVAGAEHIGCDVVVCLVAAVRGALPSGARCDSNGTAGFGVLQAEESLTSLHVAEGR